MRSTTATTRFIDDGAATKLLRAARECEDLFVRLAVEFLARTGVRRSEFLNLRVDSVVQIGSAYWLHVPLGKMRNDRYIPFHPQLEELVDVCGRWGLPLRSRAIASS